MRSSGSAIGAVRELAGALGPKRPLRDLGVGREMVPALATAAVTDPVARNSQRLPSAAETVSLLECVL
jgi:alcohol dehydrogenase class IV